MWKVLVVDDEVDSRDMMRDALQTIQPKVTIVEATNGADAVWKINNDSFQLVITDLKMPKAGGATIIKAFVNKMIDPTKIKNLKEIIVYSGAMEEMPKVTNDKIKVFQKGEDDGKLINHLTELLG